MCSVFIHKKQDTLRYTIFHECFEIGIYIYTKNYTLRYVTCLYTKIQTFRKKQDNLHYVFIYARSLTVYVRRFFMEFLKLAVGRGTFFIIEKMHFSSNLYMQKNNALSIQFLYTKIQTLCVTFYYVKNNALCVTFIYI